MMLKRHTLITVAAALLVGVTACMTGFDTPNVTITDITRVQFDTSLHVRLDSMTKTPNNVYYRDLTVGTGKTLGLGDTVTMTYTGWLASGTKFGSSSDPQAGPERFVIGTPNIIPGFNDGVIGMKVNGTRQLVIPPEMAYGEAGSGAVIPPNAVLVFVVTATSSP